MTRSRICRALAVVAMVAPAIAGGPARAALPVMGPKHLMPVLGAAASPDNNLVYHGGDILKAPKVYITYWGWGGQDPSGEAPYLEAFFRGIGGSDYAGIQTQYTDTDHGAVTNPSGQLAGTWWDDAGITDGGYLSDPDFYLTAEVSRAVDHFGYDPDANYFIADAHLHNNAQFAAPLIGYCAYHSTIEVGAGTVSFTNFPYIPDGGSSCGANAVNAGTAGALDGVSIVAGHEFEESVTDPHVDGWYDASGAENGDKCAWIKTGKGAMRDVAFGTGSFAVQSLWSNEIGGCTAG